MARQRRVRRRTARPRRRPKRTWRRRLWGWGLRAALAGMGLLFVLVVPWRFVPPPTTAFMVHAWWAGDGARRDWVAWDEIAPALRIAVVAAEDQRFPQHDGFDWTEIGNVVRDGTPRGASTISQQLAKNLYLWPGRSWARKGIEAVLTIAIETTWPKQRILEVYLNVAEFDRGVFGAEAASRHYYGQPAATLSAAQAARLAAILPSPKRRSPHDDSAAFRRRVAQIRASVDALGGASYLDGL